MDPEATLADLLWTLNGKAEYSESEAVQFASDLLVWILSGGEVPPSNSSQREVIRLGLARIADKLEACR